MSDALRRFWGMRATVWEYVPKGVGSYHWIVRTTDGRPLFVTLDDLRTKPWLGTDPESTFPGLLSAYGTAAILRETSRLEFVVAPIRAEDGSTCLRVAEDFAVAVFPMVAGTSGRWSDTIDEDERRRVLAMLARLHGASSSARQTALPPRAPFSERSVIERALADIDLTWDGGPFAEEARVRLLAHEDVVRGWLDDVTERGRRVLSASGERGNVVTHGEPHPGNIIRHGEARSLIDWDTAALAPPERDLWMLDDGSPDAFAPYTAATGRSVDPEAIEAYRLGWNLDDLAFFVETFRLPHGRNRATEQKLAALAYVLGGGAPAPYRFGTGG